MTNPAVRRPDELSLNAVLAKLPAESADVDLVPTLAAGFPGFAFSVARSTTNTGATPARSSGRMARASVSWGRG
jgi:hypothetical protein